MKQETLKYVSINEAADKFNIEQSQLEEWIKGAADESVLAQRKMSGEQLSGWMQLVKNSSVWNELGLLRLTLMS